MWAKLIKISKHLEGVHNILTKPVINKKSEFIMRRPFSPFYFRPLYLQDIYLSFNMWEPYVRKVLIERLDKNYMYIDVGAHIGYHTVLARKIIGGDGQLIAIEPDPRNLHVLNLNCKNFSNIRIINSAAGFQLGTLVLRLTNNPLFNESGEGEVAKNYKEVSVKCITLDSLIPIIKQSSLTQILLKIDVEGAEDDVLNGAKKLIEEFRPSIIIETDHSGRITELLSPYNYGSKQLFDIYWLFDPN